MHVSAPGVHTSATQIVPLQYSFVGQSTSPLHELSWQVAPPPGVVTQSSVAEHMSMAHVLLTHWGWFWTTAQCWSGLHCMPTQRSVPPPSPPAPEFVLVLVPVLVPLPPTLKPVDDDVGPLIVPRSVDEPDMPPPKPSLEVLALSPPQPPLVDPMKPAMTKKRSARRRPAIMRSS